MEMEAPDFHFVKDLKIPDMLLPKSDHNLISTVKHY